MRLTGKQLIGSSFVCTGEQTFYAVNPETGASLEPVFYEGTSQDVDCAVVLAEKAFDSYRATDNTKRGEFLEIIAVELLALEGVLVDRAIQETGLPKARLVGELGRTVNQLKLFSRLIKEGSYVEARIDRALPIANTHSPTSTSSELPAESVGRSDASTLITATSLRGSVPTTRASNSRPSARVTVTLLAP